MRFCYFKVLQFDKSEGAYSKYENSYLKFYGKNIQITHFCIFSVLHFCKILQFDKFEGADFKYGNTLSNSTKKVINKTLFVRKFMRFCVCLKFYNLANLRVLISSMAIIIFKVYLKNTEITHF